MDSDDFFVGTLGKKNALVILDDWSFKENMVNIFNDMITDVTAGVVPDPHFRQGVTYCESIVVNEQREDFFYL